jgi:heptaprenyl diphosphate synthase
MEQHELRVDEIITALTTKQTTRLARHVDFPSIDREQIRWLIDVAQHDSLDSEALVKAIHFAQVALRLHERVSKTLRGSKERQLLVLAGALFSSYFFEQLAGLPKEVLVSLGRTIQRVNGAKCALHEMNYESTEERVLLWLTAEFGLMQGLAAITKREWLTRQGRQIIQQQAEQLDLVAQKLLLSHL